MFISTPHIDCNINAIAKTVLMPGDPNRSQFIAKNFLQDSKLVNNVRGVHGYTGMWKDVPVTVMASGMGIPAIGIYSWELFNQYDVDNIIRIGSAGALQDDIGLMDIVIGQGACTNSNYLDSFDLGCYFAPIADYSLMSAAIDCAKAQSARFKVGNIFSSDNFYTPFDLKNSDKLKRMGILAVEMEAAGLYANAAYAGKRALCMCTISDHLYKTGMLTPEEREQGFSSMIEIALNTAVKMEELRISEAG